MNNPEPTTAQDSFSATHRQKLKFIIPLVLIAVSALIIWFFLSNEPEKKRKKKSSTAALSVSVINIEPQNFQVGIGSYGTVSPRTQSFLVSQVNGQITEISNKLREGSFFNKGETLLKIDDRDYIADVKISEANLADAEQALAEEMALSSQAALDWKNLGNSDKPNDLVLRKPQQQAAQARLVSAQASLAKTKLVLERTKITAPYDGRVLEKLVDLGQVTNTNTQIAEIYATDYFEVRLPLRTTDLKFINLPDTFRNSTPTETITNVNIYSSLSDSNVSWPAKLVRTESAIDNDARQLHVVAQIDNPFDSSVVERPTLKIGEYVTAAIEGKVIENAIVIPSKAIYQDTYVYIIEGEVLKRQEVQTLWQDDQQSLIKSGLSKGDRLVTTTLGQIASGTRAVTDNQKSKSKKNKRLSKVHNND